MTEQLSDITGALTPPVPAPAARAVLPSRSVIERLLPLALVVVISFAPFVGYNPAHPAGRAILVSLAALTVLAAATRRVHSARLGVALTATIAAFSLPWQINWWPLPGALGLLAYLGCSLIIKDVDEPHLPWRLGSLTRSDLACILGLAGLSGSVLWTFHRAMPTHFSTGLHLLSTVPAWQLAAIGAAFATANAAVEELLFRGAILHQLRYTFGVWPAVATQAAAFGLFHLHGYPYGPIGVALATTYGLLLGAIRLRSNGLLAPWLAHVAADGLIFIFILQAASHTH
jgi:membrane protease YdiL (CAAX protease family)